MRMNEEMILKTLHKVKDPEIDSISIVDLGMVETIKEEENRLIIELLPTFMGCPALDIISENVKKQINSLHLYHHIDIQFIHTPPWTSNRITERGREQLKSFGIAPPPAQLSESGDWEVSCPYCGSQYTAIENLFGPTACRSILYCKSCKNPFEAMKPISTLM